jgi:hypothetical protein
LAKKIQDEEEEKKVAPGPPSSGGGSGPSSVYAGDLNPHHTNFDMTGFTCAKCKAFNLLRDSKHSWYAVTKGKSVGLYKDW